MQYSSGFKNWDNRIESSGLIDEILDRDVEELQLELDF